MRWTGCRIFVVAMMLALSFASMSFAGTSEIVVDLDNNTVTPPFPALNNWSADTILIRIKGRDDLEGKILSTIDVPDPSLYSKTEFATVEGRFVTLTVERCALAPKDQNGPKCPSAQANQQTSSWLVYSPARTFSFKLFTFNEGKLTSLISFPIRVEQKPFQLGFSAGFAGFGGVKDHRYRLVPIDGDTQNATLVPASDRDIPYQIAAFAHYMPIRWKGTQGPTVGLSTKVPIEDLTVMLGWTFSARTLPVVNTGYLTIGAAYVKRDRLRSEFEGKKTVAADLDLGTLVEKRYGIGAFIALSFGFFGGENEFKGVFPSGNSPAQGSN